MKPLLSTSALVPALILALGLPAFAQDSTAPAVPDAMAPMATQDGMAAETDSPYFAGMEGGLRASKFIGKRVYVTEQDTSAMPATAIATADANWEDAGEISDLILSLTADSEAVLVDFGGFLGIGEKTVALSLSDIVMVPDSSSADDYFIVFHGTKASLEAAPAFDPDMVFAATPTDGTTAADAPLMGTEPATTEPAATEMPAAEATAVPADGTVVADGTAMTADGEIVDYAVMTDGDLIGKRVTGPNDEDVGEISAITMTADNKIEAAVIDVGGFLGIGEKPVALSADMLRLVREADGTNSHFRVALTQEQLEALPTHAN